MDLEVISKTLHDRPFRPIVFHLDNGNKQVVKHREILVSDIYVIALDDDGLPVFILVKGELYRNIHVANVVFSQHKCCGTLQNQPLTSIQINRHYGKRGKPKFLLK